MRASTKRTAVIAQLASPTRNTMAAETALGDRDFVDDMNFEGMVHGALRFSDHPRARVVRIDLSEALKSPGVIRIFTAAIFPGEHKTGLIFKRLAADGGRRRDNPLHG